MEPSEQPPTVAPAQPPAPVPAAADPPAARDTGDYLATRRAESLAARTGQPPPVAEKPAEAPIVPAPAAAAPAPPERRVSKRQETINDYERRIAEQNERIARLEGTASRPAPAPAPVEKPEAAYKRYLAMPDAPKLGDFDSLEEHSAALALFIADTRAEERQAAAAVKADTDSLTEAQRTRADSFATRIKEAVTNDAAFWEGIRPEVQDIRPFNALKPGEAAGPSNVVAEELLSSPVAPALMRKLSEPGQIERLLGVPPEIAALPRGQQPAAHTRWIVREIGKLEALIATPAPAPVVAPKQITDAPAPEFRLGSKPAVPGDPAADALKRHDTAGYLATRRQQDIAKRRGG